MWKQGTTNGYYWQAKVFAEPSRFGIDGGRVSILPIYAGAKGSRCVYNYSRGLDVDEAPDGLLAAVLKDVTK